MIAQSPRPASAKPAAPTAALGRVTQSLQHAASRQAATRHANRDKARRIALAQSACHLTDRTDGKPPLLAEAMASHMLELSEGGEKPVTEADLILRGFTRAELARDGEKARTLAYGMAAERAVQ